MMNLHLRVPLQEGGLYPVRYYDEEGNEIDPLSSEGAENLKKEAKNLFNNSGGENNFHNLHESNSSTVSAISNKATYEGSSSGTVILEKPKRSDFTGRSGLIKI